MDKQRYEYRHNHKRQLIHTSHKVEVREVSHRCNRYAEDVNKIHSHIVAQLQTANGGNKRAYYTQCRERKDKHHHKPVIGYKKRRRSRQGYHYKRYTKNLTQLFSALAL